MCVLLVMCEGERARYGPIRPESAYTVPAHHLPFDISNLSVTGLVIICELDDPPPGNLRPSMSMKMTQYLRLSDESMIRLDMDRGVSSSKQRPTENVSWKSSAADVIPEVLKLVQTDAAEPDSFPWDQYAEAARLRGILVDAEALRDLPHTVLLSDQLATIYIRILIDTNLSDCQHMLSIGTASRSCRANIP